MGGGGYDVTAPEDFFKMKQKRFDCIVMNPPFTPMIKGYEILFACMKMSDVVIALMPWLTIINSEKRAKELKEYGVASIAHLPRKVFPGSRVQTCIIELHKGYKEKSIFKIY